ncbi:MAG: PAS domain S-box protein [Halioglobus sp.]|nr:PAS domain S-box protein [Halioglobus sp.]
MMNWITITLGIAALFTLGSVLGDYLTVQPYQSTVFWPPAGISLTAVLFLGGRAVPGILLGSVCTIFLAIVSQPDAPTIPTLAVSSTTVIGWTVQPLVAAYFLRQIFATPLSWMNPRACAKGFLVIISSAAIPASVGTFALYITGLMPGSKGYNTWLIWWLADTIGMLTITPGLYILIEYLRGDKNIQRMAPARTAIALSASSMLAVLLFITFYNLDSKALKNKLEQDMTIVALNTEAALRQATAELEALDAFFQSGAAVNTTSFSNYVRELENQDGYTKSLFLIWAPQNIRYSSESTANISAERDEDSNGMFSLLYAIPRKYEYLSGDNLNRSARALIRDFLAVSATNKNVQHSMAAHVQYDATNQKRTGYTVTLVKPVYTAYHSRETLTHTPELKGFLIAAYAVSSLMKKAVEGTEETIELYVYTDDIDSGPIWTSENASLDYQANTSRQEQMMWLEDATGLLEQKTIRIADTDWNIVSNGGTQYLWNLKRWTPWLQSSTVMGLGMVVVLTLRSRERSRIERDKTKTLRDAVVISAQQPFVHLDQKGLVQEWNHAAEKTFGWTQDQVLGKKLSDTLIPLRYREAHEKGMMRYGKLGTGPVLGRPIEIEARCSDDSEIPVSLLINSVKYENKWHYFAFVSDISEQKENRLALTEALDNLKRLYEAIPDAIIVYNSEGKLIECNAQAVELFGFSRAELLGSKFSDLIAERSLHALPEIRKHLGNAKARWINARDELFCVNSKGTEFPVEAVVSPTLTADGIKFISVVRDNTKQREEEQRRQAGQMIESLGRMTGIVAHDFNNLLSIIIGHLDLMSEQFDKQCGRILDKKHIDIPLNAALRGSSMVKSLLAVAKQQPMIPSVLDVGLKMRRSLPLIQSTIGENITISYDGVEEPLLVEVDDSALTSAIMNLVVNARESIAVVGEITFTVEKYTATKHSDRRFAVPLGNYAVITVKDNGRGMSSDVLNKAVSPFFTTKSEGSASGLGLSMVSSFAKQHGGAIAVASELNFGTSVSVCMPLVEDDTDTIDNRSDLEKPTRILVVDDQADITDLLVSWLQSAGYETERAEKPSSAMRIVSGSEYPFDVMITDVLMPETNGFQLFKQVQEVMPSIEVIYISGTSSDSTRSIFGDTEPTILEKPFRKDQILSALKHLLRNKGQELDTVLMKQSNE